MLHFHLHDHSVYDGHHRLGATAGSTSSGISNLRTTSLVLCLIVLWGFSLVSSHSGVTLWARRLGSDWNVTSILPSRR